MVSKNKKVLVVVESPNKIKSISKYLGDDYVIRASFGHICDLVHNKKNRLGVDIENDFKPTYSLLPDKKDKLQSILDATKGVSEILLASDPDREGEAISFHLKDCLESTGLPIKRITFNEITKNAVLHAVKNPKNLDHNLYDAQQARRVLDRLVGFMVSPFLIRSIGPNLSAGRVQSVAVRLVVDREREIENFKPEEYWNINASLVSTTAKDEPFIAKYFKKVTNKSDAMKIKTDLESDTYSVTKVEAKEKKRNPLPPLITSKLQQVAAGRYGFAVARTMKAAQSLYESGLVTYIRTDSTRLSPESITSVREYLTKKNFKVPATPNYYASKGSAQDAHEAIRPSDVYKTPDKVFLGEDQQKIYRIIWERFVASQMEPAVYDTMNVLIESSSQHELKASGRTLKYAGWLAVATDQVNFKQSDDEDDAQLPLLNVGDVVVLTPPNVQAEQKFTQPPGRYGEGSLVKELEKRGIGRPATYADIIEKIKGRGYVELKGKVYHGTDIGKTVIDALKKNFKFLELEYTAEMETKLDKIAEGNLTYVTMMNDFFTPFQDELKTAYADNQQDSGFTCEKCSNKMVIKHGRFGFYISCIGSKCKTTISCDVVDGKAILKEHAKQEVAPEDVKCPKCDSEMFKKDGKFGPFYSCMTYPKCNGSRKIPFGKKCNKCNNEFYLTIFNNEPKLACMGYPNCKNIVDVPGENSNKWVNPKKFQQKKIKRSIKKVLDVSK
jgi:DNA topoisomerase-1